MRKLILVLVLLLLINGNVFATDVTVEIPEYDVRVNGELIDTEHSEYPILKYKNITYFPMTSDYISGLGLGLKFSANSGLEIKRLSNSGQFSQKFLGSKNVLNSQHSASIIDFAINVNGRKINNREENYPVLLYKNITYFPMTWQFAVEEFNWKTKWSNETGFEILTSQPVSEVEEKNVSVNSNVMIELGGTYNNVSYRGYKIDLSDPKIQVKTALAKNQVGAVDTLANIATANNALLAINGSYFSAYLKDDSPKDPYGILIIDGEVVHTGNDRATIGFSKGQVDIDRVDSTIYGWNGYPKSNYAWYGYYINHTVYEKYPSITVFTEDRGNETFTDVGTNYVVENGVITSIVQNKSVAIPEGGFVANLNGSLGSDDHPVYDRFQIGYSFDYDVTFKSDNKVWSDVDYATSAGPALILDGKKDIDFEGEHFSEEKIRTQSASRSAIGYTKDQQLIFVTTIATIDELADLMLSLGCYEAMNLDGGASSGLWYNGNYIKEPGRDISNIIYIEYEH